MRYYVIGVKTKKRESSRLILVEAEDRQRVYEAFEVVKLKLPYLNRESAYIHEIYDTTHSSEYRELISLHLNDSICFKIRLSEIGTYFLSDTYIRIEDIDFHEYPISAIHIQSKRLIMKDPDAQNKFEAINEKIKSLLVSYNTSFSVFETTLLWEWDDITNEMWETILMKNDVAIIFHNTNIDTIIGLAKILYKISVKHNKILYFFFVDVDNNLYKVILNETMEIIPVENGRYIV